MKREGRRKRKGNKEVNSSPIKNCKLIILLFTHLPFPPPQDMVAMLGGTLSLMTGMSFISLVEILFILFVYTFDKCTKLVESLTEKKTVRKMLGKFQDDMVLLA